MINLFKGVNTIEFGTYFQDNETCVAYLASQKWEKDYSCFKCKHNEYSKGNLPYFRRCKGCSYDESPVGGKMSKK
jgi:hypothetical protein